MAVTIILIIGIVFLVIAFIMAVTDNDKTAFPLGILGSWLMSGAIFMIQESKKPSALDVYQGKTTLEITYKDGVPVDSIVVFKAQKGE